MSLVLYSSLQHHPQDQTVLCLGFGWGYPFSVLHITVLIPIFLSTVSPSSQCKCNDSHELA